MDGWVALIRIGHGAPKGRWRGVTLANRSGPPRPAAYHPGVVEALSRRRVFAAVALLGAALVLVVHDDYGMGWDDAVQAGYGERVVAWWSTGGRDDRALRYRDTRFYGPLFEAVAALVSPEDATGRHRARRLATGATAVGTGLAVVAVGFRLGGAWTGVIAAAMLFAMPRFLGHALINSKDVPFALGVAWSLAAVLACVARPESRARIVWLGVALGFALGVRPGGLPVLVALVGVALLAAGPATLRALGPKLALVPLLAWGLMVAAWPWAWQAPLANPLAAIRTAFAFHHSYPVLYGGSTIASDALPRDYLPVMLAVVTPIGLALLALIGAGVAWRRAASAQRPAERSAWAAVAGWVVLPVSAAVVVAPNVYDGIRHFLFVVPGIALLAAVGFRALQGRVPRRHRAAAVIALVGVALLPGMIGSIRLHPYQAAYYNAWVGGVAGAAGRYETDYWLTSYREAMQWIAETSGAEPEHPVRVLVATDEMGLPTARAFASPGMRVAAWFRHVPSGGLPADVDYYVGTTRLGFDASFPAAPIVHRVGRAGADFTVIRASADRAASGGERGGEDGVEIEVESEAESEGGSPHRVSSRAS